MIRLVRRRQRTLLFLGVNIVALTLGYLVFIEPLVAIFINQSNRMTEATSNYSRYLAIAAQENDIRAAALKFNEAKTSEAFLQGASDGAMSADLQARLKIYAEQAGVQVKSIRALEPVTIEEIPYFGAHLDTAGTTAATYQMIQTIESRTPYLFVESATLRHFSAPAEVAARTEPQLDGQFDIYGPGEKHAPAK